MLSCLEFHLFIHPAVLLQLRHGRNARKPTNRAQPSCKMGVEISARSDVITNGNLLHPLQSDVLSLDPCLEKIEKAACGELKPAEK